MAAGELTAEKVSCMVLMAPAAGVKDLAIKGNMMGALFDPLNIPDYIIANDRKIGREYIQTAQSLPIYETTALYTGPVLIIQGRADEVVNEIYAEKYHQVLTNSELKLMDNENHMFTYDTVKDTELVIDFFVKKFEETKPVDSEE